MAKYVKNKGNTVESRQINIWAAFRDIIIAGMNKGQLPVLIPGLTIFALVFKLDKVQANEILNKIIAGLETRALLGWVLCILLLLGWLLQARFQRVTHKDEIDRLSRQRTDLQAELDKNLIETSRK